jgi:hypothetical protein
MMMKTYAVQLGATEGAEREVVVQSPTDVQAADAARPLMRQDESILSIAVIEDTDVERVDGAPPKTQAAELASQTPGFAAAPAHSTQENDHG